MVMLRPEGKFYKVAKKVLKEKGVKLPPKKSNEKITLQPPYLQH
jgi:hypothetical protein